MSIDVNFVTVLRDAGIPTTQAEMETKWREIVTATGSSISNDDRMSPFWRFVTACVTTPMLWLVNFLVSHSVAYGVCALFNWVIFRPVS